MVAPHRAESSAAAAISHAARDEIETVLKAVERCLTVRPAANYASNP